MTDTTTMRAAFEAIAPDFKINIERASEAARKRGIDGYKYENTEYMFKFFQAALSQAAPDVATWQERAEKDGLLVRSKEKLFDYVLAENADLRAALASRDKDAERLDWMEANHAQTYRFESTGHWRISNMFAPLAQADTVRAAIDAAMARERK